MNLIIIVLLISSLVSEAAMKVTENKKNKMIPKEDETSQIISQLYKGSSFSLNDEKKLLDFTLKKVQEYPNLLMHKESFQKLIDHISQLCIGVHADIVCFFYSSYPEDSKVKEIGKAI